MTAAAWVGREAGRKFLEHLGYAERLAVGRNIGSGPVEGANEQLVARRLKLTGARWRPEHARHWWSWSRVDSPDRDAVWTAA